MFAEFFASKEFADAMTILQNEFPLAIWETFYVTVVSTAIAIIIGLPLGVLLAVGGKDGILPLPRWLLTLLDVLINLLRSVPFLILMIMVIPLTRLIVGTPVGTVASIVPLVIAAFPFIARLAESCIREVNPGVIEAAQSMGASPLQIIVKVLIPESVPSLISNATIAITTILGYSAMSGIIGGGGLGKIAINYGYYRYKTLVMILAVILLIVMVQIFQSLGTYLSKKSRQTNLLIRLSCCKPAGLPSSRSPAGLVLLSSIFLCLSSHAFFCCLGIAIKTAAITQSARRAYS